MWVFDGEEWTQDDGSESTRAKTSTSEKRPRYEEMMPELQVVEIVPVKPRHTNIPFPLP